MFLDGRLMQLGYDLWALPEAWRADPLALLRQVLPPEAILSGWACAMVCGVRDAGPSMAPGLARGIPIYLPRHINKGPAAFQVLRCDLGEDEWQAAQGTRLATPARAAYDMIRFCRPLSSGVSVGDCFAWQHNPSPVTGAELLQLVDTHPRARGNPRVRRAAPLMSDRARSIAETKLRLRWLEDVGLLAYDVLVNATLTAPNGAEFEIDLIDTRHGIAAEYDGAHHADSDQRSRDSRKDQAVYDAGLTMVRYNAPDLQSTPGQFSSHFATRRRIALDRGCDVAVRRLLQDGVLVERPLRNYRPAVEPLTLLADYR
ncbi:hypothetical protein GCM10027298_37980 [Epidermidibacterium keratini]